MSGKANASEKGEANGIATLNEDGKVPTEQLPNISLATLSDVEITAPTDKQALVYNAQTEKWEPGDSAGASFSISGNKLTLNGNSFAVSGQKVILGIPIAS